MTTTWKRAAVHGRRIARCLLLGVTVPAVVLALGSDGAAHAVAPDECIREKMADGASRPEAVAACVRQSVDPSPATVTPLTAPGGGLDPGDRSTADVSDDGTSTGLLIAVGLGGAAVGAGAASMFGRRRGASTPTASPAPQGSPAGFDAPRPGASAPPGGGPAASDRATALVTTLVDLSDRVSSEALRVEIVAALARAGVHTTEPRQGEVFDRNRMRGVGGQAAPDPTWIGRIAATERAGFHDGTAMLRLPDVIVYTAEG